MRDEHTPTQPEQVEALSAQIESLRNDPSQTDLYRELTDALREKGLSDQLADVLEIRAPHETNATVATTLWAEAAEARLTTGEQPRAERDLRQALALDPANERAGTRLSSVLVAAERYAEAAAVIERELDALTARSDVGGNGESEPEPFASRRAARHREVAALWGDKLGRVDRALDHFQRAWQLEPSRTESLDAAREIYASLGDDRMVCQLYEAELEVIPDAGAEERRAEIELELGHLKARLGDGHEAAVHFERALELAPDSDPAREALAEAYASPAFAGETERQRRAGELFVELGRHRMTSQDEDTAINYLRRALGVDPYSEIGSDSLETALEAARRWEELDRLYRHRLSLADSEQVTSELLLKRAKLFETRLADRDELKRILEQLAGIHGPGSDYAVRLGQLYREDEDWSRLSALMEVAIDALLDDVPAQARELLELATIVREHLGDKDRAAEILHRVLTVDAQNAEALARYSDHFRERRDWRGLADLTEFTIENLREGGSGPGEIVRRLEELAQIVEVRLGDVNRAIQTWRRIEQVEPDHVKAREALRRLMSRAKMWESLVGVLEQEAQQAETPVARAEALRRIAQVYRERQVNPRRAISLYEEVLTLFPDDEATIKALMELYEREGDDAGLATTIRRQLDLDVRRMLAEQEISGRTPTAREWPVARRVERLTALRRLASMYEQRLADVEGVVFACSGVLEILPGDRDALERMERVLDRAGDVPRLEQTLEYHAAAATGPAERAKVLRRLARLAGDGDEVAAMERWEQVVQAAPNDAEALEALAGLYERHERWEQLAHVLDRSLMGHTPPEPGSPDAAKRAGELKRFARVLDEHLHDAQRAMHAWDKVLALSPRDRDTLAALARLYAQGKHWRELTSVLERQAPLYLRDDPTRAVGLALERARLLEERLGNPGEAIRALESLLHELDPSNVDAHKALRRLYEAGGDFEAAVRIAEREVYLTDDREQRLARALEIGLLCRDRLEDPPRALQAFRRALEIDPDNQQALRPAAELYAQVEDWPQHIAILERLVGLTADSRESRGLMLRIAHASAERLGDARAAFKWYRQAHQAAPDATTIGEIRRAAEAYGLWRELAEVYEDERKKYTPVDNPLPGVGPAAGEVNDIAYIAACRELAAIAEHRLGDGQRAIEALYDALKIQPDGEDLLSEAERVAHEADDKAIWYRLLECMELPLHVRDRAGRVALHLRRARIREERLDDRDGATEELLRAFSWAPDRDEVRRELLELAERTDNWSDVLGVQGALFARATTNAERIAVLGRKADILEDKLGDEVRAFRTHLSALLIDPESPDTVAELWRLARDIGEYDEGQRTPRPEPPPAYVEPDSRPVGRPQPHLVIEASKPMREPTEEISITDLIESRTDELDIDIPVREDQTQELDVEDVIVNVGTATPRRDPTIELRTQDLIEVLRPKSMSPERPRPRPANRARTGGPPPPPPPRPTIERRKPSTRPLARPPSRIEQGVLTTPPTLPARPYPSPWAELAAAYDSLPAPTTQLVLRWQFRAAQAWETGAGDIPRAFDTLARAVELAPNDMEARDRLHRLAEDHDEWDRLAALYENAADTAASSEAAAELLMEVAEIRSRQGRDRDTETLYRKILGMRPEEVPAREKLEAMYRADQRWVDLAASLEERTDPRLGAAAPEPQRPALLRELAEVYSDKLGRPHDAIDALERLRGLCPEDVTVLDQLAALYGEIGRWSKVIEVLARVGDVAEGSDSARRAMHTIGRIYEVELELPDRAIDAYSQAVGQWPDDTDSYEALDRLYRQHARWRDLEVTLNRRAALARTPADRAELLGRRAEVLMQWLDAPDEAAAALRHARTIKPEEPRLAELLVDALVKSGRDREAAAILEGRIGALKDRAASDGDVAALLIRLASIRGERLRDVEGAKQVLQEALELVPDHPTALKTLATLADAQKDPRAYAEAKLREADALDDVDAKVEALVLAGATLRDRCRDIDAARAAFERVLELRPFHAEATWALAGLVEQGGDVEAASRLLEARLEGAELDPQERAQVFTQLAALSRLAGIDIAAQRRLNEALDVVPDHLPAIIAQADLLGELGRWEDLQGFLLDIIPRLEDKPTAVRAELHRRLALAYEQSGRDDDAYQTLVEADRLHRRNLLVKLALGENRYRARRWREAALHLGALADHEDADKHPAEVAEGLHHAALAEIRSLRPEKAGALYERAIVLKPNYTPALHALAELCMERGDVGRAADLLTRQAMATDNPAERTRLFEALGDMALMTLADEDRAKVCFEAAVNAAKPLESRHLPLLEKLLERQDLSEDLVCAARTAELMASFADGTARAARLQSAAENYLAAGDRARALAAAERAVQADPTDLAAVAIASEILIEDDKYDRAAGLLGRALSGSDDTEADDVTSSRRSMLWYRLGAARMARGDNKGATAAFESSVAGNADSDGAMASRRELLTLWSGDASRRDTILSYQRMIAADSLALQDIVSYAHGLRERGNSDGFRAVIDLAGTMGHDYSEDDVAYLGSHPAKLMAEDEAYRGTLNADDRAELIADPSDQPIASIVGTLWEAAPLLWSEPDDALERAGITGAERLAATTDVAAAAMFTRVARALEAPATVLYTTLASDAPDVQVVCVSPPIVVLGPRTLSQGRESLSDLELRFQLARAAELARPERVIAVGLGSDEFSDLLQSLVRVFGPGAVADAPDPGDGTRHRDELLRTTLPVKVRAALKKQLARGRPLDAEAYLAACQRAADRAGLIVCGDFGTARRLAAGSSPRHLQQLVLQRGYLAARGRLGIG